MQTSNQWLFINTSLSQRCPQLALYPYELCIAIDLDIVGYVCMVFSLQDNRVNGTSVTSRSLGNCYLYPHLIPEPHVTKKTLRPEDQFLIIANSSLWR